MAAVDQNWTESKVEAESEGKAKSETGETNRKRQIQKQEAKHRQAEVANYRLEAVSRKGHSDKN